MADEQHEWADSDGNKYRAGGEYRGVQGMLEGEWKSLSRDEAAVPLLGEVFRLAAREQELAAVEDVIEDKGPLPEADSALSIAEKVRALILYAEAGNEYGVPAFQARERELLSLTGKQQEAIRWLSKKLTGTEIDRFLDCEDQIGPEVVIRAVPQIGLMLHWSDLKWIALLLRDPDAQKAAGELDEAQQEIAALKALAGRQQAYLRSGETFYNEKMAILADPTGIAAHRDLEVLRADNEALRAKLEEARTAIDRLEDGRRRWLKWGNQAQKDLEALRARVSRLDELLASEEVPEGLVERLPLPSHDLGDGWTRVNVAEAAWRWFREALLGEQSAEESEAERRWEQSRHGRACDELPHPNHSPSDAHCSCGEAIPFAVAAGCRCVVCFLWRGRHFHPQAAPPAEPQEAEPQGAAEGSRKPPAAPLNDTPDCAAAERLSERQRWLR